MLKALSTALLSTTPDGISGCHYACIEAFKLSGDTVATDRNFKFAPLDRDHVKDWLQRQRQHAPPQTPTHRGGIRILLAQPHSIQKRTTPEELLHLNVQEEMSLPTYTFSAFQLASGVFSMQLYPPGSTMETCTRIGFVFRNPQKVECCTGGLSMSYDFNTGMTTALILGYAFQLDKLPAQSEALADLLQQLRDCYVDWDKPLILPCSFLVHHSILVQRYIQGKLSEEVIYVEYCIGVTEAGRSGVIEHDAPKRYTQLNQHRLYHEGHMLRDHAKKLISMVNNLTKAAIFAHRSPEWDTNSAKFLLGLLDTHKRLQDCSGGNSSVESLKEVLNHVLMYSEVCAEIVHTSQQRLQLQLNILYTSIAQDDGQTSARLAASAGKDSTSMKILAVITAIYLPGTFVATLFSMGMFDWQSGSTGKVAEAFWIYWTVAIPLTVITLSGWAWWWKLEKARFEREVRMAVQQESERERKGERGLLGDLGFRGKMGGV